MDNRPRYIYVGQGVGGGEEHVVIYDSALEVITVAKGHSWLGPRAMFRKHFRLRE